MREIVALRDVGAGHVGEVGAKAANLGELISAGFPVPDGFCLTVSAYDRVVAPVVAQRVDLVTTQIAGGASDDRVEASARSLRDAIEAVALPAPLLQELLEAYSAIGPRAGTGVAVRSSGTHEDSSAASFAGQYHTDLGVCSFDEAVGALKRCWASLWRLHAIRYREVRGIPHAAARMAVIVQLMVPAETAGVMFTVDPTGQLLAAVREGVTADPAERIVIESSWGCGEGVVSGLITPDRFYVSRSDLHVERAQLPRTSQIIGPTGSATEAAAGGGTTVIDLTRDHAGTASVTDAQAAALARLGVDVEAHFGCPQDIEWAISRSGIAILQARPITHRPRASSAALPEAGWESPIEGASWARISICDSWLPEPLSPLFATTLFPCLIKGWLRGWAGPERAQASNPLVPKPMSSTINGFAYLRIDYPLNRYPLRTVELILRWFRFHLGGLEREWRTVVLPRHVARLQPMRDLDLTQLESATLLDLIAEIQDLSADYWRIVAGLAWYWNVGEWLLARLYPSFTKTIPPDEGTPGHASLLQGYPTRTFEAEVALHDLARSDEGDGEFMRRFDRVLTQYGHQVYNLDFVEATPAEDASSFRTLVEAYRDGRAEDPRERLRSLAQRREHLHARIAFALRRSPVKRAALEALLRWNRYYGALRDDVLFSFTLGWPVMRQAHLELGRRLVVEGATGCSDDVFFLTGDELAAAVASIGTESSPRGWTHLVGERRARRQAQRLLSPPDQVPPATRVFLGRADITSLALFGRSGTTGGDSKLRGSGVSPGRVTAPARRIRTTRDFQKLQKGEVVVASYITPAWSGLLAIAGGVVTDTGGALSHGSIVAREYGIPAVMGTANATKVIEDGQVITVDGDRGAIY